MYDLVIIGGGPAGLAASIYLARANLNPLIVAGSPPGGQLLLTSDVENYPGFDSILGPELIIKMRAHSQKFGTRFIDDNVKSVDFSKKPYQIITSSGQKLTSQTILVATGADALWLGLENEQRLRGKGVSACATCDGFFFKNKIVAVVGGGDTAMEEALTLTKFAQKVYIIHRRDSFRASKIMQDRVLNNPKIKILWQSAIIDVIGDQKVEGVKIESSNNETMKQLSNENILKVDGLFLAIGHKPSTGFLVDSRIMLDEKGYIITSSRITNEFAKFKIQNSPLRISLRSSFAGQAKLENIINKFDLNYQSATSIPGIFAAGDCVDYVYRQAATAVGMGVASALEIEKYLELN